MAQSNIHPTAIIDDKATIDPSVTIGAFSMIGPDVHIGKGTTVANHVTIKGPTIIGEDNRIYPYACLGEDPQDKKYDPATEAQSTKLEIGNRNTIREFCTFNRGTVQDKGVTKIGDDNWVMAYVHIAHDCTVGNNTILANNSSLAGHVDIHDYAILGGFTLVHQFCKVGAHIITAVNSVVFKDIPPFVTAAGYDAKPHGINSEGLRRRGFDAESIKQIKRAYKVLYRKGHSLAEATELLKAMQVETSEIALFTDFITQSTRGLIR